MDQSLYVGGKSMRIAVVNEGSTKSRNKDIMSIVSGMDFDEVLNLGMKDVEGEPDLSYMETALIAALVLNLNAVDFVIGGCGTGQGFMNAVLQYPGVACGLLMDPAEAFLFARVNAGNCISLQLNKGYGGIGGDINVKYILENIFVDDFGQGYPPHRKEIQISARKRLENLSIAAHRPMVEILDVMDKGTLMNALNFPGIKEVVMSSPESELKEKVLRLYT